MLAFEGYAPAISTENHNPFRNSHKAIGDILRISKTYDSKQRTIVTLPFVTFPVDI